MIRPSGIAISVGLGLAALLSACQTHQPQGGGISKVALQPFEKERAELLVPRDPSALYGTEQLAPLLILSDQPLPATIRPLDASALTTIVAAPATIQRIDLRIAHNPAGWPAGSKPAGPTLLYRAVQRLDPSGPVTRVISIVPPDPAAKRALPAATPEQPGALLQPLLSYLAAHPELFPTSREAHPEVRESATDDAWVELKIRIANGPTSVALVPRTEIDSPGEGEASRIFESGLKGTDPKPDKATMEQPPARVSASADGVPFTEAVDPAASLYTFTLSQPIVATPELLALAQFLTDTYLKIP